MDFPTFPVNRTRSYHALETTVGQTRPTDLLTNHFNETAAALLVAFAAVRRFFFVPVRAPACSGVGTYSTLLGASTTFFSGTRSRSALCWQAPVCPAA